MEIMHLPSFFYLILPNIQWLNITYLLFQVRNTDPDVEQRKIHTHYGEFIMGAIASQITSLTIVYSIFYSDADQRKHQNSASVAVQMASFAENISIWWRHHVLHDSQ